MRVTVERFSWSFDSSGVSISTSGPCTNTLGPVRAYGAPFARASTQTLQPQPGRGIVTAPPEPRISTLSAPPVSDTCQTHARNEQAVYEAVSHRRCQTRL